MPEELEQINQKGYTITRQGRQMIAKALATGDVIEWTRIMIGEGSPPPDVELADMDDLAVPAFQGTSTVPEYRKDRVAMTIELRSDMVDRGFYITEFGVYARLRASGEEVLFVYGCQGDYLMWIGTYADGQRDIRRWPITIVIGEGVNQEAAYSPGAFMTAEDIAEYTEYVLLPELLNRVGTPAIPIVLEPGQWTEVEAGEGMGGLTAVCRVPVNGLTANCLPLVSYGQEYGGDLADCGMGELVEAVDGALIFYAQSIPANAIHACAFILGNQTQSAGGSGGTAISMRPATATSLGAIKGSDSIKIDPDGTAHAVLSDDIFASDADVDGALDAIYGDTP